MLNTARAALSAALLIGFYLYAFAIVAGLGVLTVLLIDRFPGAVVGKLGLLTLAVAAAILIATWRVLRAKPAPQPGLILTPERAPELWAQVRAIAAEVETRAPDEIRLVAEVNAAVDEDARLLGLRGGRRYLYVGLPLLQAMSVSQMRSVLAHELGHYSHQHTRLAELTYRGMSTIVQTIIQVGPTTLAGWLLRGYAAIYSLVSAAVSQTQEIEADRASVRVAGRRAAASALRELPGLDAAWDFYLANYVGWGLDSGYAPSGVLAQFPKLLEARSGVLAAFRASNDDGQPPSRYDSHPPIGARIALIDRAPEGTVAADDRPAGAVLLGDVDAAAAELEQTVFTFGDRVRVPYEQYTNLATQWRVQRRADVLYRASARLTAPREGRPDHGGANLGTVLDLVGAGRSDEVRMAVLRQAELGDADRARVALEGYLVAALSTALATAGVARWRHSWAGAPELVGAAGPVDVDGLARRVAAGDAAGVRAELTALGVDVTAAGAVQTAATAGGAAAVAGIVNTKVNGKRSDVVILDQGLVIVPGIARWKGRHVRRRMVEMLTEVPAEELAGRPEHRFIPYEEIAGADRVRRIPVTYELVLHSGERVRIRWGTESEEVGDGKDALAKAVAVVGAPAR